MKYFFDERRAIHYVIPELITTLQDDINNQKASGEPKRDYIELEDKIKDIEEIQPLMEAAPELLEACQKIYQIVDAMPNKLVPTPIWNIVNTQIYQALNKAEGPQS